MGEVIVVCNSVADVACPNCRDSQAVAQWSVIEG